MTHALTIITFVPLVGSILILALPNTMKDGYKWIAVAATIPQLLIAIFLYQHFDTTTTAMQFTEKYSWMAAYHINYFMGVDGISISMVLLTALICFISVFASFGIEPRRERLLRTAADARHRHDGRVRLARFFPVLHFLGSDAAADVLPDRHLGRPAPRVRRDQVFSLYLARLGADPARDAGTVLLQSHPDLRHDPARR